MEYNHIEYRKPFYKIKGALKEHLSKYSRLVQLPISYEDLTRYRDLIPILDKNDNDTLWRGAIYDSADREGLNDQLIGIYEMLVADGDKIPFLKIENIDFCTFGNSKPFRIKVVNELNDNYDFYYIKRADASRVYGLELEDIFSPDKISFLVDKDTLVEDHIVGVPCDEFLSKHENEKIENRMRFAKEFVKFNERCFTRLLGDMRAYNFVVEITQDFDNIQYRLRAMDFDQQSYEGRKNIYLPQYYSDNRSMVELAQELMSASTAEQYKRQERVAMRKRYLATKQKTKSLLRRMKNEHLSTKENVEKLATELSVFHKNSRFLELTTMGQILTLHLELQIGVTFF
ncbi:MAG: hypothetical protein P8P74_10435 [Crocinitomicaceae bacterium]|nr:hypothetical protein [Crocinitomicaceae bacterium]